MKNALIVPSLKDRSQNNWPSLQMIGQGLEDVYESILHNKCTKIEAPYSGSRDGDGEFRQSVAKLPEGTNLIFPYAIPKQVRLITSLLPVIQKNKLQCKAHLYGDFFQQWSEWNVLLPQMASDCFSAAALSSRFAKIIGSTLAFKNEISVLVPGLDLSSFAFDEVRRRRVRANMNVSEDEFLVLTVSRINDQKGFFRNYEVVKKLSKARKVRWILAGDFDDWNLPYTGEVFPAGYTYASVMQFLASQKPNFSIDFLGHRETSDVTGLINAADLFLHLSRSFEEDFSLAAREAVANGVPCLLENWGPFPDLTSYENVVFKTKDLSSLLDSSSARRKSLSHSAVSRLKLIDAGKFSEFLSTTHSFDYEKINPPEVDRFIQIMEGCRE